MMDELTAIGMRLAGFTVDYRRSLNGWPAPWRVRIIASKNERSGYRIVRFGRSFDEAANEVLVAVEEARGAR